MKIYVGIKGRGYLSEEMMSVVYDFVVKQESYEFSKAKPRKIGDKYLLEMEVNDDSKQLLKDLRSMDQIKFYKRTQSWKDIYKMAEPKVKSS